MHYVKYSTYAQTLLPFVALGQFSSEIYESFHYLWVCNHVSYHNAYLVFLHQNLPNAKAHPAGSSRLLGQVYSGYEFMNRYRTREKKSWRCFFFHHGSWSCDKRETALVLTSGVNKSLAALRPSRLSCHVTGWTVKTRMDLPQPFFGGRRSRSARMALTYRATKQGLYAASETPRQPSWCPSSLLPVSYRFVGSMLCRRSPFRSFLFSPPGADLKIRHGWGAQLIF